MNKYKIPLLSILRKANNYKNSYLEKFMNEYHYYNLAENINNKDLEKFLTDNGLVIKVAGIDLFSVVNGEGLRYTIFTQGCIHNCKGCQNPQTHNYDENGTFIDIDTLYEEISSQSSYIKGITLSGGDPLYEKNYLGVLNLCKKIKNSSKYHLDIWLYTGSVWEDISSLEIMKYVDIVVDGRFEENLKSLDLKFKGSSNQRIIDVKKSLLRNEVVEWELHT